jgi:hypothetical protein
VPPRLELALFSLLFLLFSPHCDEAKS